MINMYTVYRITNLKSSKYYIGSTNNAEARKNEHFTSLKEKRHSNKQLQSDFLIFGAENFIFEVIIDGFENRQQMLLKEYELINKDFKNNYNIDRICPILNKDGSLQTKSYIYNGKSGSYQIKKKGLKNWKLHPNNKKKKNRDFRVKETPHADKIANKKKEREEKQRQTRENFKK